MCVLDLYDTVDGHCLIAINGINLHEKMMI